MTGRTRRFLATSALVALTTAMLGGVALAGPEETFLDQFNSVSFSGDDGTLPWTGPWTELGESDGAAAGSVRVDSDGLRLGGDEVDMNGRGAKRQADLSGAVSATLCFDYRRQLLEDAAGSVTVWVSDDGGNSWTDVAQFYLGGTDPDFIHEFYDITPWISSNTKIKFEGSGSGVDGYLFFDNIEIKVYYPGNPPTFDQDLPDRTDTEGDEIMISATATDPDDTLTYSAKGLPAGVNIDPNSGIISGTLTFDASTGSPYSTEITVDDEVDGSASDTFVWTVLDANGTPDLEPLSDLTVDELSPVRFTPKASDPDSGDTLSFLLGSAPAGATIDSVTGAFSWTPDEAQGPGSYYFYVKALDESGAYDKEWVTITVNEVNAAPVLINPGDLTGGEGDTVALYLEVIDADQPENRLSWTASGLPDGLSIDAETGKIRGTISYGAADRSPYTVKVVVTDQGDPAKSGSASFVWKVTDTNRSPHIGHIDEVSTGESQTVSLKIKVSDPDGDDLRFSAKNLPPGLEIDPETGVIDGTVAEGAAGDSPYEVTVTVTDDGEPALTAKIRFDWHVSGDNEAPSAVDDHAEVAAGGSVLIDVLGNDSDPDGDELWVDSYRQPEHGTVFQASDGALEYSSEDAFAGSVTFTYTVSDSEGALDTATVSVMVTASPVDDGPPVVAVAPSPPADSGDDGAAAPPDDLYMEKTALVVKDMAGEVNESESAFSFERDLSPTEGLMVSFSSAAETIADQALGAVLLGVLIAWLGVVGLGRKKEPGASQA